MEDSSGYASAFALLAQEENLKVVVCDSETLTVQQALRDHAASAAQDRKERIAVVPGGAGETVTQLTTRAASLNSERVVLVAPGRRPRTGGRPGGRRPGRGHLRGGRPRPPLRRGGPPGDRQFGHPIQ